MLKIAEGELDWHYLGSSPFESRALEKVPDLISFMNKVELHRETEQKAERNVQTKSQHLNKEKNNEKINSRRIETEI